MSELVEQTLKSRLGSGHQRTPLQGERELILPEAIDALTMFGAPLWSSGRQTAMSLEEAIIAGIALSRLHPSILRVLPVVLWKNRSRLSLPELRRLAGSEESALGMLLDLTAEVTGFDPFRIVADELRRTAVIHDPQVPFFATMARGERYMELARIRTPDVVRRWGFLMATPIDDFRETMERYCSDKESSDEPT